MKIIKTLVAITILSSLIMACGQSAQNSNAPQEERIDSVITTKDSSYTQ